MQDDLCIRQFGELRAKRLKRGVSIDEDVDRLREEAASAGQIASDLIDPITVRILCDSCDCHSTSLQLHEHKNIKH